MGLALWIIAGVFGSVLLLLLLVYLAFNFRLFCGVIYTLPRDLHVVSRLLTWNVTLYRAKKSNLSIAKLFDRQVALNPGKVVLYFRNNKWTCAQIQARANQIANYFYSRGLRKGDSVSIFLENSPEFVFCLLGFSKLGVVSSLVNTNLRMDSLLHCLQIVQSKAIIFSPQLSSAISEVLDLENMSVPLFCWGTPEEESLRSPITTDLTDIVASMSEQTPVTSQSVGCLDQLCYIFTSGTTGLPKPVVIGHVKLLNYAFGSRIMTGIRPDDTIYVYMPLYHASALTTGIGQMFVGGTTVALRSKFSATNFWRDCNRYHVTVTQYIGEICRYLLAQPPSADDTLHSIRFMLGNGLRKELWKDFMRRFNIPKIVEFYGSTEGTCNIVNVEGHVGSVGYVPRWATRIHPVAILRVDSETGEPVRDPRTGFCIRAKPGEAGEMTGRIQNKNPARKFEGYANNQSATNAKIITNVFKNGDRYFRSGDILMMDDYGHYYFQDRTGDTFRWKGENVSTFQVESIISSAVRLKDVAVYGVSIPGTEGRAGMAAVADPHGSLDLARLKEKVTSALPAYARPLFIRVMNSLELTGTFKFKKTTLQDEGFDITRTEDKMFVLKGGEYVALSDEIFNDINEGRFKF